ncbi:hypothetical protein Peur_010942 [Populus x canadensis]
MRRSGAKEEISSSAIEFQSSYLGFSSPTIGCYRVCHRAIVYPHDGWCGYSNSITEASSRSDFLRFQEDNTVYETTDQCLQWRADCDISAAISPLSHAIVYQCTAWGMYGSCTEFGIRRR